MKGSEPVSFVAEAELLTHDTIIQYFSIGLECIGHLYRVVEEQYKIEKLPVVYAVTYFKKVKVVVLLNSEIKLEMITKLLSEMQFSFSAIPEDLDHITLEGLLSDFSTSRSRILITTSSAAACCFDVREACFVDDVEKVVLFNYDSDCEEYGCWLASVGLLGRQKCAVINFFDKERSLMSYKDMYGVVMTKLPKDHSLMMELLSEHLS